MDFLDRTVETTLACMYIPSQKSMIVCICQGSGVDVNLRSSRGKAHSSPIICSPYRFPAERLICFRPRWPSRNVAFGGVLAGGL